MTIPTLDEELAIDACLDAVGVDPEVEVVVSDGGSRDRTVELAVGHPNRPRIVSGGRGRGAQLARGAQASRAALLLFVHADCRLPAGWRPALEDSLVDPRVALACFWLRTERTGEDTVSPQPLALRALDLRSRSNRLPYGDQGFGLRRDVYDRVGGFPGQP